MTRAVRKESILKRFDAHRAALAKASPEAARCPILVGIDPGVQTGFAVWDRIERKLMRVETRKLHDVLVEFREWCDFDVPFEVWMEDARLRKKYTNASAAILQGVGSVKRDCSAIEDACIDWGIPYKLIHPVKGGTKWTQKNFERISKWTGPCSVHARDASILVLGAK